LRSLDRFYEYLEKQGKASQGGEGAAVAEAEVTPVVPAEKPEKQEKARRAAAAAKRAPLPKPAELPGAALPGFRYVLRGGVTVAVPVDEKGEGGEEAPPVPVPGPEPAVAEAEDEADDLLADKRDGGAAGFAYLPPLVEADEPTQVIDAPARPRATRRAAEAEDTEREELSEGDAAALWRRLPRHIQLLVGMHPEPQEEVAQKYYTRGFKETRAQLIERLLDPTLTLEDTARVLGVCPTTVRRYTNRGTLPCYRTIGQQRRFRLSDVLAFLEEQRRAAAVVAAAAPAPPAKGRKAGATVNAKERGDGDA
jgi:excisionase family DNA binding protein